MTPGNEDMTVEVRGNTLRVCGELHPDQEAGFEEATRGLMETAHGALVIDLTGARWITSGYVRQIALLMVWGKQHGRSVSVRATEGMSRLFFVAGLDKLGSIETGE